MPTLANTKILVVDDSLVNLALLDDMLERNGFQVLLANTGERALQMAHSERPDIILLDVIMPGWDGYETCERLKADNELSAIPVLFLSGLGETENKVRALQVGAVDYVSKPFQEQELMARVRTHAELASLRAGLEDEVSRKTAEIQSLLEALQISYQKMQETSVLKTEFLRNISHEFRTPMNIILGVMDEMMEDTPVNEEQQNMISEVQNAGHQLMEILNNMLNFAQQFEGELAQEKEAFNLCELLDEVVCFISEKAVIKGLRVARAWEQVPCKLYGYRQILQDVLYKLLDNAVKYTPQGQIGLTVCVEEQNDTKVTLQFTVHDTGIGISEDKQNRLFETFSQVDGSSTRIYGGLGMGLALVKLYVETLGGDIRLDSHEGQGSQFSFAIILEKQATT